MIMHRAPGMEKMCLSVIVPAYNEENTIRAVIDKLLTVPELLEIIVVDDCSSDNTWQIAQCLQSPQVRVLRHERNGGKTEALKTGFAASQGDIVLVQDADLEYDPAEIPSLLEPILEGRADVVYGSRFLVRKGARVLYFYHYLANRFLTFFSNLFTNVNMTDVETGYKVFRGDIIRNMVISSTGFGFEIEVTAKVAKLGCAIYEVPISYHGRTYEEGKKIGFTDGLQALWLIFKYNLFGSLKGSFHKIPELGKPAGYIAKEKTAG
jgi:glycosyltransferase involved in cell wall biosynthesis